MTDITIPPAALEAARAAWLESASDYNRLDGSIHAACLAMLKNWPGVIHNGHWLLFPHTKLPLPTEQPND